jgi:hypothetical protein
MTSSNSSLNAKSSACAYIESLAGIFSWSVDCAFFRLLVKFSAKLYDTFLETNTKCGSYSSAAIANRVSGALRCSLIISR